LPNGRKKQSFPLLENREQWGARKFKIAQNLAHPPKSSVFGGQV
jgi:hypothetical protein